MKNLEEQFNTPEPIQVGDQEIEVVDINPENKKTNIPVFFAPGWSGTPTIYKENILKLAECGREVVSAYTYHGVDIEEDAAPEDKLKIPLAELRKAIAVLSVLQNKNITRVDAVGHSEAGIYLAVAAYLHPEKFRNIVLVNPAGVIGKDKPLSLVRRYVDDFFGEQLMERTLKDKDGSIHYSLKKQITSVLEALKSLSDIEKSLEEVDAISSIDVGDLLKHLRKQGVGIAIINAADDKVFPLERIKWIVEEDCADIFYTAEGTHNVLFLEPEIYTRLIDKALDRLGENKN